MNWTTLYYDGDQKLLTCDSPVYFNENEGFLHNDGEITIPLSSATALWLTWKRDSPDLFEMPITFVKEINRRTASNAVRFIYYHVSESWIEKFMDKANWHWNRLQLR